MAERLIHTSPARLAAAAALLFGAVALGGLWATVLGFVALCAVADGLIPLPSNPRAEADRVFAQLARRRRFAGDLPVLDEVHPWTLAAQRRERGLQSIPVDSLRGSVEPSKARQFDHRWRPDRSAAERWKPLWQGRRSGSPIPPIEVFRVDGAHWVRDGHHRASVAFHQGAPSVEAEVVELLR